MASDKKKTKISLYLTQKECEWLHQKLEEFEKQKEERVSIPDLTISRMIRDRIMSELYA